jgi:hypothetical protein
VQDDAELPGHGDHCFLHAAPLRYAHAPSLQGAPPDAWAGEQPCLCRML